MPATPGLREVIGISGRSDHRYAHRVAPEPTGLEPAGAEPSGLALWCESMGWMPSEVVQYLGHPFVYPTDSQVGTAIGNGWEWDNVLRPIVAALVPDDKPMVCEVGSNIGASLLEILAVKPHARVLAFEPADRYRAFLEYNLRLAGFSDIEISSSLVDRTPGTGFINTDGTSGSIRAMPHLTNVQAAPVTTLDQAWRHRDPLTFLKTDTDGHDMEVLHGAEETLRRDQPVLFLEFCPVLMVTPPAPELAWLQGLGYRRLVCLDNAGRLVGVTTDAEEAAAWADAYWYCDILTCPSGSAAEGRLDALARSLPPAPPSTRPA